LSLPEAKIDIAKACLILSKDIYPNYDVDQGLNLISMMTARAQETLNNTPGNKNDPEVRIGTLNTFLFRPGPWNQTSEGKNITYEYDLDATERDKPETHCLAYALMTLRGTCSSLPMVWYVIADKLGWPVKPVRMPAHIFLRYSGTKRGNIDPSAYGGYVPDSQYISDFCVKKKAVENGTYMKSMTKKEFISTLLVNNCYFWTVSKKDTTMAIKCLELALKTDPTNAPAFINLGLLKHNEEIVKKGIALGYSHETSDSFKRKQKESIIKQRKGEKPWQD
jgi:regulator of sirC expression with transglutaminase-like and TPR domain